MPSFHGFVSQSHGGNKHVHEPTLSALRGFWLPPTAVLSYAQSPTSVTATCSAATMQATRTNLRQRFQRYTSGAKYGVLVQVRRAKVRCSSRCKSCPGKGRSDRVAISAAAATQRDNCTVSGRVHRTKGSEDRQRGQRAGSRTGCHPPQPSRWLMRSCPRIRMQY